MTRYEMTGPPGTAPEPPPTTPPEVPPVVEPPPEVPPDINPPPDVQPPTRALESYRFLVRSWIVEGEMPAESRHLPFAFRIADRICP